MCMRMPGFCLGWGWCVECDVKDEDDVEKLFSLVNLHS